jgi:hypothetical protein
MSTVIISLIIAALIALNIRYILKQKRKGHCVGCQMCEQSLSCQEFCEKNKKTIDK